MNYGWGWRPYVSVAELRKQATKKMSSLKKQGLNIQPVEIQGRKIARTFWGESWCQHLESFSDYANRLPRGRTYVRNGSVCHLNISSGEITAIVSGSELYDVKIKINSLPRDKWSAVKERCAGKIGSLLELLQGKLSHSVMSVVTHKSQGIFPQPAEINLDCSCPDWATMCKHVAAVLYGVGARLDEQPALLFLLRAVDHEELIAADAIAATKLQRKTGKAEKQRQIAESDLGDIFGIDIIGAQKPVKKSRQADRSETAKVIAAAKTIKQPKPNVLSKSKTKAGTKTEIKLNAAKARPLTAKSVRDLRARLELSQSRLAELLGVSVASINSWESQRGRLKLQARSLSALNDAMDLTKSQAARRLKKR